MKYVVMLILATLTVWANLDAVYAEALVSRPNQVGHRSFNDAKKVLPNVYKGYEAEFYCGCLYSGNAVDLESCGYKVRKDANRASRIEWEHIVPAWSIGHQRQCWQNGGRANCTRNDKTFVKAEGDLHNLVPAIGEFNNDRANYRFTVWDNNPTMYGQCPIAVDFKGRRAQPRKAERGKITRIYFYMHDTYRLRMSEQQRRVMCVWNKTYRVDAWERVRNQRIAGIQGNSNRYVTDPKAADKYCSKGP